MFKVNCLNPIAKCGTDNLGDNYALTENTNEADAILVRSAAMHDMTLAPNTIAVARAGAGVNNIPLDRFAEEGVVVFNTPGANANGVKELVIAAMLYASRDIIGAANWVQSDAADENIAKTAEKQKKNFAGTELKGKKLGVIGLGAIGAMIANTAVSLGMDVYGYDPYVSVEAAWKISRDVKHITNVNDIYTDCDLITIHVPLLDSTKGMVDAEAIAKMKDGVIFLNFARDILVDEAAMVAAVESGHVAKYITDFPNPTVVGKKNIVVTPHIGASTAESEDNCAVMAVKELRDFIENGNIINSVNYPRCDAGIPQYRARLTVCHKNIPHMLTQFTGAFSTLGVNVPEMLSKSRGDYAYTIIDIDDEIQQSWVETISKIDGVLRVRVVK